MIFKLHEPINLKAVRKQTREMPRVMSLGIRLALNESGKRMVKYTRTRMRVGQFTGKDYYLGDGKIHVASGPYEYPHRITGALSRSINYKTFGSSRLEYGTNLLYGLYLEEGTKDKMNNVKIKERLYLLRTAQKFDKHVQLNIIKRVNIEIKKSGTIIK